MNRPIFATNAIGPLCLALAMLHAMATLGHSQDISAPPLGGSEAIPDKAKEAFRLGVEFLDNEQFDDAIGMLTRAIRFAKNVSGYPQAQMALAKAALQVEEYPLAKEALDAAIAGAEETLVEFSDGDSGLDEDAFIASRGGLTEDELAEAYDERGKIYLDQGVESIPLAIADFLKATDIAYKNKDYLFNLGSAYAQSGQDPLTAIKVLDKVLEMDDQHAGAYDARGQAHSQVSIARRSIPDLQTAVDDFSKAIALDPTDKTFFFHLGQAVLQHQRYDLAVPAFTDSIDAASKEVEQTGRPFQYFEPLMGRALAWLEIGKISETVEASNEAYEKAIVDAETVLQVSPQSIDGFLIRGIAFRLMEQYDSAIVSFTLGLRSAAEGTETQKELLFRRGIVWYYLDDYGLALTDLERASRLEISDVRPQMWQGFTYAKMGNYFSAVKAYGLAIERNNRYAPAFNNRGLAYLQLGQTDKAISDFNEVILIDPGNSEAYLRRGVAYAMTGQHDKAVASYRTATQVNPDHPEAFEKLAEAYGRTGQSDLASQARSDAAQARNRALLPPESSTDSTQPEQQPADETSPSDTESDLDPLDELFQMPDASDDPGTDPSFTPAPEGLPGLESPAPESPGLDAEPPATDSSIDDLFESFDSSPDPSTDPSAVPDE